MQDAITLEECDELRPHIRNALQRDFGDEITLAELAQYSDAELARTPRVGKKGVARLRQVIARRVR